VRKFIGAGAADANFSQESIETHDGRLS
jgi:hypothetical protein